MPKGQPNKRYTPEFKQMVVETMQKEGLSYKETARQFTVWDDKRVAAWERIYFWRWPRRIPDWAPRMKKHRASAQAAKAKGGEKSHSGSPTIESGGSVPKKMECLGFRRGTPKQKAQVIWELRHGLRLTGLREHISPGTSLLLIRKSAFRVRITLAPCSWSPTLT